MFTPSGSAVFSCGGRSLNWTSLFPLALCPKPRYEYPYWKTQSPSRKPDKSFHVSPFTVFFYFQLKVRACLHHEITSSAHEQKYALARSRAQWLFQTTAGSHVSLRVLKYKLTLYLSWALVNVARICYINKDWLFGAIGQKAVKPANVCRSADLQDVIKPPKNLSIWRDEYKQSRYMTKALNTDLPTFGNGYIWMLNMFSICPHFMKLHNWGSGTSPHPITRTCLHKHV